MTDSEFIVECEEIDKLIIVKLEPTAPDGPCIELNGYRIPLNRSDEAREELLRFIKNVLSKTPIKKDNSLTDL